MDDSKIVRIAKLVLILTSHDADNDTKLGCLKLAITNKLLTQDEAMQLLIAIPDLQENFKRD